MKADAGFTLMELLIAVVIASIIAALAVPFYGNYVREANRTDAQSELLALANEQEKRFPNNNAYTDKLADLGRTDKSGVFYTPKGLYTLEVAVTTDPDTFTITAKAAAGGSQVDDTDCKDMAINSANQRTPANCWGG